MEGMLYKNNCLPFGLASAPRTFTKVTKPFTVEVRSRGFRIVIYIDDILLIASSADPVATSAVRAFVTPGKLGLDCQLGEVGSGTSTGPGHRNRFDAYAVLPSRHQGQEGQESLPRAAAVHPRHSQ